MLINVLCIGKLKENYLKQAADEYIKRLSRFTRVNIVELPDEKVPESLFPAQREGAINKEGERLLKAIGEKDYVIALCINGNAYSSKDFAFALNGWVVSGGASVTFIIGGSLGLSRPVINRANASLSLSGMTFPHQLTRIILLEQLYRAFKINANEPYHK